MADLNKMIDDFNKTNDSTGSFDKKDIDDNKIMGVLSYISWLVLIPIFCARDSKFARFHVNQGIVLAIAETLFGIVIGILDGIPFIGWLFSLVGGLAELIFFILAIIGIINAVNGKAKDLPVIGSIRLFK